MGSLPNDFNFSQMKPSAAPARGYTARLVPDAGTSFKMGDIITISIPAGRSGEYLRATESSLFFQVTNNGEYSGEYENDVAFAGGAWSVISKLEIFCGSNLLESISDYATLHNLFYDLTASSNYRQGQGTLLHGVADVDLGTSTEKTLLGTVVKAKQSATSTAVATSVAIQLISSLLGLTAERAIPIGLLSADLRLQITLNDLATGFCATTSTAAPSISITNVEYHAVIVQLDPSIDGEIAADNKGVLSMHGSSFRTYTNSIASGATFDVVNIPMRFSSLRYSISCMRPAASIGAIVEHSTSARERAGLTRYQYRMGSQMVPQRPVTVSDTNATEVAVELMRLMGTYESYGDSNGIIFTDKNIFLRNDVKGVTTGTFAFGADISAFGGTRDDLMNSGNNTLSTPISLELTMDAPHDVRLTTVASFDCLYLVDLTTGLMTVRF